MRAMNVKVFEVPGCGFVSADIDNDGAVPMIQFGDGTISQGLPRTQEEVAIMGYTSIAEANFVHEALHLFVAHKGGFVKDSILYRAGQGVDFSDRRMLDDARHEERIVLGLQIAFNDAEGDALTTNKVHGFTLHIAAGAREYARKTLLHQYGIEMDEMLAEFAERLEAGGYSKRDGSDVLGAETIEEAAKFKVGDRVRLKDDLAFHRSRAIDREGTIIRTDGVVWPILVKFSEFDAERFTEDDLELIEEVAA
jgi:hypothetical protein